MGMERGHQQNGSLADDYSRRDRPVADLQSSGSVCVFVFRGRRRVSQCGLLPCTEGRCSHTHGAGEQGRGVETAAGPDRV